MFTIEVENFANRRMHHLKINREGRELAIQVNYFPFFIQPDMPWMLNNTFLSYYPELSVEPSSGDRNEPHLAPVFENIA